MNFKIRHQGSPKSVENMTFAQIVEGMQDGNWDSSDEVMPPNETRWVPIDQHPQLGEIADEIEEDGPLGEAEDDHLDMNPLIDVCLVLLVFFILTTSVSQLEKFLDMPKNVVEASKQLRIVKKEDIDKTMIQVFAYREGGKNVIKVENEIVREDDIRRGLLRYCKDLQNPKNDVLIDAKNVDWGTIVKIIDAASGANIKKVMFKTAPQVIGGPGGTPPAGAPAGAPAKPPASK